MSIYDSENEKARVGYLAEKYVAETMLYFGLTVTWFNERHPLFTPHNNLLYGDIWVVGERSGLRKYVDVKTNTLKNAGTGLFMIDRETLEGSLADFYLGIPFDYAQTFRIPVLYDARELCDGGGFPDVTKREDANAYSYSGSKMYGIVGWDAIVEKFKSL